VKGRATAAQEPSCRTGAAADDWASEGVPNSIFLKKPFAPAQLVTAVSQLSTQARRLNDRKGYSIRRDQKTGTASPAPPIALASGNATSVVDPDIAVRRNGRDSN